MGYEDRLDRALDRTPAGEHSSDRFSIPDADVRQEGSTTVYENFQVVVSRLDREQSHVLAAIRNELGTSGHVDERGRARLTGSFKASRIDDAIARYAEEYVFCPECGLPDTRLERERGALVMKCTACGALTATDA